MLCYLFFFYHRAWSSPTQGITAHHLLYYFWFCRESFSREFLVAISLEKLPPQFAVKICRQNLLWLFAAKICCGNLPLEFAAGICRGYLPWVFCICKQILFIYEKISFTWIQSFFYLWTKLFFYDIFSVTSVSFCSLHKKWSFPLRISSINVTKFAEKCGFSHIYWGNP